MFYNIVNKSKDMPISFAILKTKTDVGRRLFIKIEMSVLSIKKLYVFLSTSLF